MNQTALTLIQTFLKKGDVYVNLDKKNFEDYHRNMKTLGECRKDFLDNNNFPQEVRDRIDAKQFESWLKTLGW